MEKRWPELEYLYHHVPNGGSRNRIEAANLKEEGVKAGVPDLEFPAARGRYTGLHIELKHGNNKVTADQDRFLKALRKMGRNVRLSAMKQNRPYRSYQNICGYLPDSIFLVMCCRNIPF